MTPQEKQIALVEFDGWKVWQCNNHGTIKYFPSDHEAEGYWEIGIRMPDYRLDLSNLPDYLNDFNATRSVEEKLDANQHFLFREYLWKSAGKGIEDAQQSYDNVERAYQFHTAAERADALLMAIGKL